MKSARIKRRNADVFMGAGSPPAWTKTTPYGTYNDGAVRMADKVREIGKNANRTCHKQDKNREISYPFFSSLIFRNLLNKFK